MDGGEWGRYFWPSIGVLWFSIGSVAINMLFLDEEGLLVQATVATALCAGPSWYYIVEVAGSSFIKRGLLAGLVIGMAVHPMFLIISPPLHGEFTIGNPFGAILFSPYGLVLFGYLTIPAGVVAGGSLGMIRHYIAQNHDITTFKDILDDEDG